MVSAIGPATARVRHFRGIALVVISTIVWSSGGLFVRLLPFDM